MANARKGNIMRSFATIGAILAVVVIVVTVLGDSPASVSARSVSVDARASTVDVADGTLVVGPDNVPCPAALAGGRAKGAANGSVPNDQGASGEPSLPPLPGAAGLRVGETPAIGDGTPEVVDETARYWARGALLLVSVLATVNLLRIALEFCFSRAAHRNIQS
jgi:hypothetical protein